MSIGFRFRMFGSAIDLKLTAPTDIMSAQARDIGQGIAIGGKRRPWAITQLSGGTRYALIRCDGWRNQAGPASPVWDSWVAVSRDRGPIGRATTRRWGEPVGAWRRGVRTPAGGEPGMVAAGDPGVPEGGKPGWNIPREAHGPAWDSPLAGGSRPAPHSRREPRFLPSPASRALA